MPTLPAAVAREPKRQRGRLRVAAIMEASVEVFVESGFDAATMTDIATRSKTAIGSLYRFFPSKESLADALLFQYAHHVMEGLARLSARATEMTADELAEALVDFRLTLQTERSFAIALLDARGDGNDKRTQFRTAMLASLAEILRKALPPLTETKSELMAIVLSHLLKGVAAAAREEPRLQGPLLAEIRKLVGVYLSSARTGG